MLKLANCGPPLKRDDVADLESLVGGKLPESMISFYSSTNGGTPDLDFLKITGTEPMEINLFLPIRESPSSNILTINEVYARAAQRRLLPPHLVPFAHDSGLNYYCVDALSGNISYWMNDVYDPTLSQEANWQKAFRPLFASFDLFLSSLTDEAEAYA